MIFLWKTALMLPPVSVQVVSINVSAQHLDRHKLKRDCCRSLCPSERLKGSLSLHMTLPTTSMMQPLLRTFRQALIITRRALRMGISQISSPLHTFGRYRLLRKECCYSFSCFLAFRGECLAECLIGTLDAGAPFDGDWGDRLFLLQDTVSLLRPAGIRWR